MRTLLLIFALACPARAGAAQSVPPPEAPLDVVWKASGERAPVGLATLGAESWTLFNGLGRTNNSLQKISSPNSTVPVALEGPNALSAGGGKLYATSNPERSYFPWDFLSEAPHTDMGLVQLSPDGVILWQATLEQPGWQVALDVAALSAGGAVVLGKDGDKHTILVWSVDNRGKTRWVSSFGTEPGDIVALPSGGFAVLGTYGSGTPESYNDDVMLWLLNSDGTVTKTITVRRAINARFGGSFFRGSVAVSNDSIVVATEWPNRFGEWQPLQIASFDLDGAPRWMTPVGKVYCDGSLFAEAGGDVLLACKERELTDGLPYFDLTRFDGTAGAPNSERVAVPACSDPKYWLKVEIAAVDDDGGATLVGMQPIPDTPRSTCSWIGRVQLPAEPQ